MTINIVTLAGPASGKTVYLSSIYQRFSIQGAEWPYQFRLDTDQQSGRSLNKLTAQLVNPNEEFPSGTKKLSKWSFDCKVKASQKHIHSICSFNYVDYAGGLINEDGSKSGQENDVQELKVAIKKADALIILLDGVEIFHLMQGKAKGNRLTDWLNQDLKNIFIDIQDTTIPVYFVVTKWDLMLNNLNSQLQEVRDELMQLESFQGVISQLTMNQKRRIIRLIPISSLGNEFAIAKIDKSGIIRGMEKKGKLFISPYNVELPLAYALIDTLTIYYQRHQQRDLLTKFALKVIPFAAKAVCPPALIDLFEGSFEVIQRFQNHPPDTSSNLSHVKNHKLAIKHLLRCFYYITKRFEHEYPGSKLNHPDFFLEQ